MSNLVESYVDAALAQLRRTGLMRCPDTLPEEMRDTSIQPSRDWKGWKPVASSVTDLQLDSLEHETKLTFPPVYREFLKYLHFIDLTERGVRFEKHRSDSWQQVLRKAYFKSWPREQILDVGLLPFGSEAFMDAGPVCFDTRSRMANGDCPVVFWDHEWVGSEKEINPMFSSCAKMFECLALTALSDIDFFHHDETDDVLILPQKQRLLQNFLDTDPNGAGGSAKKYWTCWGVTPISNA
jgi:SMI1-KNR4 cell-wall